VQRKSQARRHAGFTLVEVMIALMIGVIGIVVIMQTFAVSEGFKRTATSGTDAQINGSIAAYMLERDIRTSGYNMNSMLDQGCITVRRWFPAAASGIDMHPYPAEINPQGLGLPAADANTDVLVIQYGSADSSIEGSGASQKAIPPRTVALATDPFTTQKNLDTWKNGDVFISVQPDGVGPGVPSCVMHQISGGASSTYACGGGTTTIYGGLYHVGGGFRNFYSSCNVQLSQYNSATGILDNAGRIVPVVTNGFVYNMGPGPVVKVYMVRGGNLTTCDWSQKDCTIVGNYDIVVNDIVSLRAVYGMDLTAPIDKNPGSGTITWTRAPLTTNGFLASRTMAMAIELTARSGVKEKHNATSNLCEATPDKTRPDKGQDWLYQSMAGAGIDLSTTGIDWDCYRYKLYQTVVPIRNTTWRP